MLCLSKILDKMHASEMCKSLLSLHLAILFVCLFFFTVVDVLQ